MNVPFTQRFEYVTAITRALTATGSEPAISKTQAIASEEEIFRTAQSTDEYHQRCNSLFKQPTAEGDSEEQIEQSSYVNQVFNEDGPTIGRYKHATFHADGRTSTIFKAKPIDHGGPDKVLALKVTTPSQLQPPHDSNREVRLLQRARHPNVVPLLDSFQQPGGKLVLVFPFLQQDLENLLRTDALTLRHRHLVYDGLFSALQHLHSIGIIHRDVKPSNILLRSTGPSDVDAQVYLIDFGIAWSPEDPASEPADKKITDVGTTCYRPPELLFGYSAYDTSLDIWAAGCVVAEMIRPRHTQLFDAGPVGSELALIKSIFSTLGTPTDQTWPSAQSYPDWNKVRFKDFPSQPWEQIMPIKSPVGIDFLQRTVCFEPTHRLTASQALEHPLATSIGRIS